MPDSHFDAPVETVSSTPTPRVHVAALQSGDMAGYAKYVSAHPSVNCCVKRRNMDVTGPG